ncbi:MAG: serine/threonine protein kinase [Myxococcales bacterium]
MATPAGPQQFGRYELLKRIGAGGMGEVWLARLKGLAGVDKICVVKKILPHLSEDPQFVSRFLDEAKVVVHLAHGNIAQVFEMGQEDEQYYMAMEYVEGRPLAKVVQRLRQTGQPFPLELAVFIGIKLCDALAYAHGKKDPSGQPLNVVHRDISPANILISYSGEVKVIDFGAALSTMKESETAPRVVIGNLSYMSPEQAQKKQVDQRADIYSASVVLWELTSWHQMPVSGDYVERWRKAAYPKFQPPSMYRPQVPAELDRAIMKGLAPKAEDRLQNAEELRDELQRCLAALAPDTSQSSLGAFVSDLFAREAEGERAFVAGAGPARRPPAGEPELVTSPNVLDADREPTRTWSPGDDDVEEVEEVEPAPDPNPTRVSRPPKRPELLLAAPLGVSEGHTQSVPRPEPLAWKPVALGVALFLLAFGLGAAVVVTFAPAPASSADVASNE